MAKGVIMQFLAYIGDSSIPYRDVTGDIQQVAPSLGIEVRDLLEMGFLIVDLGPHEHQGYELHLESRLGGRVRIVICHLAQNLH